MMARHADRKSSHIAALVVLIIIRPSRPDNVETLLAHDYAFFLDQQPASVDDDEPLLLGVYPSTLRSASSGVNMGSTYAAYDDQCCCCTVVASDGALAFQRGDVMAVEEEGFPPFHLVAPSQPSFAVEQGTALTDQGTGWCQQSRDTADTQPWTFPQVGIGSLDCTHMDAAAAGGAPHAAAGRATHMGRKLHAVGTMPSGCTEERYWCPVAYAPVPQGQLQVVPRAQRSPLPLLFEGDRHGAPLWLENASRAP